MATLDALRKDGIGFVKQAMIDQAQRQPAHACRLETEKALAQAVTVCPAQDAQRLVPLARPVQQVAMGKVSQQSRIGMPIT
ncbi:MAG: hypothetical protein VW891_15590, partial [Novosphingobium sp.]